MPMRPVGSHTGRFFASLNVVNGDAESMLFGRRKERKKEKPF